MGRIVRGAIGSVLLAVVCGCATEDPDLVRKLPSVSLKPWRMPFKLGMARYTMYAVDLDRALEIMREVDLHDMGLKEGTLDYGAGDAAIAAYRRHLGEYGVELVSAGPEYYKTADQVDRLFRFAKRCGFKTVSVVPYEVKPGMEDKWGPARRESESMLDALEACVKKYDIRAAIHNHGPDCPDLYPTAEAIRKRIERRDRRIGICLDVGHQLRAGGDPVAAIRKYGDRIYEIHLKNVSAPCKAGHAMQGPRGVIDIPGVFQALLDVGFDGYCLLEYERDYLDNAMGVAESVGYYRGVCEALEKKGSGK